MEDGATRRQFDTLIERAGLTIPPERVDTMLNAYKQVLSWTDIVRTRRPATAEPSHVYDLDTISRLDGPR